MNSVPVPCNLCGDSNLRGDEFEILFLRRFDRFKRDGGIKSRQASLIRYRQSEQINVGELAMTLDVIPAKASALTYADDVNDLRLGNSSRLPTAKRSDLCRSNICVRCPYQPECDICSVSVRVSQKVTNYGDRC